MKKIIIALAIMLTVVFSGCIKSEYDVNSKGVQVIVIDSCEYIHVNDINGITHKGNCKYCAERRRKENETLLENIVIELY